MTTEHGSLARDGDIAFEAYGVRVALGASEPELLERIRPYLPPGWTPCPAESVERRYSLEREKTGAYAVARDGTTLAGGGGLDLDLALELLDSQVRIYIGRTAPGAVFIHAGVVGHRDRAIVIPGRSFGGKTTLVAALLRAGAVYYSDEFAVLDSNGLVHPYAKPLSIRNGMWMQTDHAVESFGGTAGEKPLAVGAIVVTSYRPDAEWAPQTVSSGAGAMALLANAVAAKERPAEVLRATSAAAKGALVLEGDRGEADEVAPLLLEALERQSA